MVNPCRDCKGRYVGCHCECNAYKAWKSDYNRKESERKSQAQSYHLGFYSDGYREGWGFRRKKK